jgi:putative phosphoribosyl transferase
MFEDRKDAGRQLVRYLEAYHNTNAIVLGMPRGGVVVAFEVANALCLELNVMVARKIGAPGQPELAIGAIGPGEAVILNDTYVQAYHLTEKELESMIIAEQRELTRRIQLYCGKAGLPSVKNRTVILIDDGVATGLTALVAIRALRKMEPTRLIFAAGVCAPDAAEQLRQEVDEMICIVCPRDFYAVGAWYRHFEQTTDTEVLDLLKMNRIP